MAKDRESINEHIRNKLSTINTLFDILDEYGKMPNKIEGFDTMIANLVEKGRDSIKVLCRLGVGIYEDESVYTGEAKENKETGNTYTGANDGKNGDCASSKKETPVLIPINEHYTDVTTVTLNGVEWFKSDGFNKNRPEERKLKSGDAIVYKKGDCKTLGFMIIRSFDYPADHAARAIYGRNPYKHSDGTETCTYYSDYSPSFSLYRFATEDEIRDFFNEFGKERVTNKLYLYYLDKIKETVPDKYDKYFVV
jgi:hypothetical protein